MRKKKPVIFRLDREMLKFPDVARKELERQLNNRIGNFHAGREIGKKITVFNYLYGRKK